jgi:hypothetical protein
MPSDYFMHKPGARTGMLTLISKTSVKRNAGWMVACDCGNIVWIRSTSLRVRTNCGCIDEPGRKHGAAVGGRRNYTQEYRTWVSMRDRCRRVGMYKNIPICARWNLFKNFLADMGLKPSPEHTIDRIDNSLGYSPENCRWATRQEQAANRRGNIYVMIGGSKACIAQAARQFSFCRSTLLKRIRRGMTPAEALIASDSSLASIVSDCAEGPFLPRKRHVLAPVGDPK